MLNNACKPSRRQDKPYRDWIKETSLLRDVWTIYII